MQTIRKVQGFTLVELSLSLVFIAILSLTVAYIINDTIASYRRGVTLKQVNTIGMSLVDDISASIRNAPVAESLKAMCEAKYKTKSIIDRCNSDEGRGFMIATKFGDVAGVGSNVPLYGIFCTGDYSYIWNSGYFFDGKNKITDKKIEPAKFKYESGKTISGRLLKIKDDSRSICSEAMGNNYQLKDSSKFSVENEVPLGKEEPVDLLASDSGSNEGLVLYELDITNPARSEAAKNNAFYLVSFILGTVQGGINIDETGGTCAAPEDYANENFDYCAINKFNFAVQATRGR